jgi:hypothetical protein
MYLLDGYLISNINFIQLTVRTVIYEHRIARDRYHGRDGENVESEILHVSPQKRIKKSKYYGWIIPRASFT